MEEIFSPVFFSLTSTFLPYHTFLFVFFHSSDTCHKNSGFKNLGANRQEDECCALFSVDCFSDRNVFVLCVSTKKVFDLLKEKDWQFNRQKIHRIEFPNALSVNS